MKVMGKRFADAQIRAWVRESHARQSTGLMKQLERLRSDMDTILDCIVQIVQAQKQILQRLKDLSENQRGDQRGEKITKVVFRVYKREGAVIALFPDRDAGPTLCESYMHVGGHAPADYPSVVKNTQPAKPEEYEDLKRELESTPYNYKLRVVKRAVYVDYGTDAERPVGGFALRAGTRS